MKGIDGKWSPKVPFDPARFPVFYGWVVVAAATIGIVFSIPGQTMGFSVFTDILMRELGLTRVQLSMAYCVGTVLSGFSLPYLGRLFDRFGARRMVVYASAATGLVLLYLSQTRRLADVLLGIVPSWISATAVSFGVILIGFYMIRASAQGVLTLTSRNVIGKWFDYHRGAALAVSGVVTAFTFSIAPRFLDLLIAKFGWSGAWMVLGFFTLTVMVSIGWLFFRDNPEECGLIMDGPLREGSKRVGHADSIAHRDYTREEALRTWAFWTFNFTFVFISFHHTAFTFHIVSIGEAAGRLRTEVIGYFVPMSLVSVVTNMGSGWLSSRTRLKCHLAMMNAAALLGVIGVIHLHTTWGVVAFILGNGMCGGFFSALSGVVWPRFFGRRWLGAISGVGMASMVIASGIGPLVFSLSLHWTGSYAPILWISCAVPAALLVASAWADNPQRKAE
jgi:OFA family oxalate/formate antiporter-like MFS transporter